MITKFPDIVIALPWRARMIPFAHRRIAPKLDSKTEIKHPCYNPPFWPRGIISDLWVVVNAFATDITMSVGGVTFLGFHFVRISERRLYLSYEQKTVIKISL